MMGSSAWGTCVLLKECVRMSRSFCRCWDWYCCRGFGDELFSDLVRFLCYRLGICY